MKKEINSRNVSVAAKKNDKGGLDIYLDFSGKREYLMYHRPNEPLYELLKNGISLDNMRRMMRNQLITRYSQRLVHTTEHLMKVIDDYIEYREEDFKYGFDAA